MGVGLLGHGLSVSVCYVWQLATLHNFLRILYYRNRKFRVEVMSC